MDLLNSFTNFLANHRPLMSSPPPPPLPRSPPPPPPPQTSTRSNPIFSLNRQADIQQDIQRQYYHNHITKGCYVYLPQTGAHIRWGGLLRVANGYNTAHFRGSPIFRSVLLDLKDTAHFGYSETANDAFEGIDDANNTGQYLPLYVREYLIPTYVDRYLERLAETTKYDSSLSVQPFITPHKPPSFIPYDPNPSPYGFNLQANGMPRNSFAFEILNCNSQPPLRFGCMCFVHRSRLIFIGGQLSYIDVEFNDTGVLPSAVFDLTRMEWSTYNNKDERDKEINSYIHSSSCQSGRHTDSDEVVGYIWGGIKKIFQKQGRNISGRNLGPSQEEYLRSANPEVRESVSNLQVDSCYASQMAIQMVWFAAEQESLGRGFFNKNHEKVKTASLFHSVELKVDAAFAAPQALPIDYHNLSERDMPGLDSFGFLVCNSRMPPPSLEQFKLMRSGHHQSDSLSTDPWDILYLFHRNGEVWSLALSPASVCIPDGLRWTKEVHHWMLPPPFCFPTSQDEQKHSDAEMAKILELRSASSVNLIGVVPRARFTHNVIPENRYPSPPPAPCSQQDLFFDPFTATSEPFRLTSITPSKKHMLVADSEFVIVFQWIAKNRQPVVAESTTFVPRIGHCVNEGYRVRTHSNVNLQAVTVVTPHFMRPLPPPTTMLPISDSRRIDSSNVDAQTNKVIELPPVRPFQAVVHGVQENGNNPENGLPVSTYLTRSPMTLKESVAQIAMRFFSEGDLKSFVKPQKATNVSCTTYAPVELEKDIPELFAATDTRPALLSNSAWLKDDARPARAFIESNAIYQAELYGAVDDLSLPLCDTHRNIVLEELNHKLSQFAEKGRERSVVLVLPPMETSSQQKEVIDALLCFDKGSKMPFHQLLSECGAIVLPITDHARWRACLKREEHEPMIIGKVSASALLTTYVFNTMETLHKGIHNLCPPLSEAAAAAKGPMLFVTDNIQQKAIAMCMVLEAPFLGLLLETYRLHEMK